MAGLFDPLFDSGRIWPWKVPTTEQRCEALLKVIAVGRIESRTLYQSQKITDYRLRPGQHLTIPFRHCPDAKRLDVHVSSELVREIIRHTVTSQVSVEWAGTCEPASKHDRSFETRSQTLYFPLEAVNQFIHSRVIIDWVFKLLPAHDIGRNEAQARPPALTHRHLIATAGAALASVSTLRVPWIDDRRGFRQNRTGMHMPESPVVETRANQVR